MWVDANVTSIKINFLKMSSQNLVSRISTCFGVWQSGHTIEEICLVNKTTYILWREGGQGPESNHAGLF